MLIDNKLLLFGGKGGVGKTSCATATSIYAASKGKKTLILSTDPAHSLSDSFNIPIGNKITRIENNLDALELDVKELLKEYKNKNGPILKKIADEGTFFSKEEISRFFDLSLPGLDELMALLKITDILEKNNYDLLILDTAPTGHTIRLLEIPNLLSSYIKVLSEMRQKHKVVVKMMVGRYIKEEADELIEKMIKDVDKIKSILKDKTKTRFIPITIPESMSIFETEKLIKVLEHNEIQIEEIYVNNIINDNCNFCISKNKEQEKQIEILRNKFKKYKIKRIPLLPNEVRGETLKDFSEIIFENNNKLPLLKHENSIKEVIQENKSNHFKINKGVELILFGGKGGVGKTSIASSVSLKESESKKVLIFSTDPAHSLSDSFNIKIGDKITKINNNLSALELDSNKLFNQLKERYKKEIQGFFSSVFKQNTKATIDAPYDRKVMEDLFELAPPGIDEIMALNTIINLIEKNEFDIFILDTAPTGHTIRLLEMPEIAETWISTLLDIQENYPISDEIGNVLDNLLISIKRVKSMLIDKNKTSFIVVTIPEVMGLLETKDFIESLKNLKIPLNNLIINKITPQNKCNFCLAKREQQYNIIRKFKDFNLNLIEIELQEKEIKGINQLNILNKKLYGF